MEPEVNILIRIYFCSVTKKKTYALNEMLKKETNKKEKASA